MMSSKWTDWLISVTMEKNLKLLSHSPHTNNQYESQIFAKKFCLFTFWVNIYKTKVLNKGQSTSKNANIWTKDLKTLHYTLIGDIDFCVS